MRKSLLVALLIIITCICSNAQQTTPIHKDTSNKKHRRTLTKCPKWYIGLSTGFNNESGALGLDIDVPVAKQVSVGAGAGVGTWAGKFYTEGRYYFGHCNRGWAFGGGFTYSTGVKDLRANLLTIYGNEDVVLRLKPIVNTFVAAYRFWNLGRRGGRFYINIGYSFALSKTRYEVLSGHMLNSLTVKGIDIIAPGGFVAGLGFSFPIHWSIIKSKK